MAFYHRAIKGDLEMLRNSTKRSGWFEISWRITRKCNYACPYCVIKNKNDEIDILRSYDQAEKINRLFDERKSPWAQLYITGGETTLLPLPDIIRECFNSRFLDMIRVTSNGTASVEFYRDLRKACEEKGYKLHLRISLHEMYVKDIEKFVKKAIESGADDINTVMNDSNYELLIKLEKEHPEIHFNHMVERKSGGALNTDRIKNVETHATSSFQINGECECSAGRTLTRINEDGKIGYCAHLMTIGNLSDDDYIEKVKKTWRVPFIRCSRESCPGCYAIYIKDLSKITFTELDRKK